MAKIVALVVAAALLGTAAAQSIDCKDITTIDFQFKKDIAAGEACVQDLSGASVQKYESCERGSQCRDGTCSALDPKKGEACSSSADCMSATDGASNCVDDVCRISSGPGGACEADADCGGCGTDGEGNAMCTCTDSMCKPTKASGATCDQTYQCPTGTVCIKLSSDADKKCQAKVADGEWCEDADACMVGSTCEATDYATDPAAKTCQKKYQKANGATVGPSSYSGSNWMCESAYSHNGECANQIDQRTGSNYVDTGSSCASDSGNKPCRDPNAWCICDGNNEGTCKAGPANWMQEVRTKQDDLAKCMYDNCPPGASSRPAPGNCAEQHCKAVARYSECTGAAQLLASFNGGTPDFTKSAEINDGPCSSAAAVAVGAVTALGAVVAAIVA